MMTGPDAFKKPPRACRYTAQVKKLTRSTGMILAGMLLLSSMIMGVWLISHPSNPIPEPLAAAPAPGLPEQNPPSGGPAAGPLPAIAPEMTMPLDEAASKPLPAISPEMAVAIRDMSNRSTDGLPETINPDGSTSMELSHHFQSVSAAVRDADGKIVIRHGEDFLQNIKAP